MNNTTTKLSPDLRIPSIKRGKQITITVNSEIMTAYEGESVHAALIAANVKTLRKTAKGENRGIFCGMGICYECLVTINNRPDQRACMTPLVEGMEIVTSED